MLATFYINPLLCRRECFCLGISAYCLGYLLGCFCVFLRISCRSRSSDVVYPRSSSFHLIFTPPIRIISRSLYQSCSHWVLITILNNGIQRFIPPNTMFVVSRLPNRTTTTQTRVNLFRCMAFERLYQPRQCLFTAKLDNGVDMIRHHDHTKPSEPLVRFEPIK